MRRGVLAALLGVVLLTSAAAAQNQLQFFVSVTDAMGNPVTSLTAADVEVRENGTVGKVLKLEPIDWPVKVQVLIDNGIGVGVENLVELRNGVRGLLGALPEGVEVTLLSTAPQPRFIVRPTTDRAMLLKGADLIVPDGGAGRFIDAISEAAQRIDRDKGNYFPVIIALGSTAAGGGNITDQIVERMFERLGSRASTVHVVMLSSSTRGAATATNSIEVGIRLTELTGGRYENIAAAIRLASVLPELGKQVAASHARQSRQFRVTFERPNGAAGALGNITLGAANGMRGRLSLDGHLP